MFPKNIKCEGKYSSLDQVIRYVSMISQLWTKLQKLKKIQKQAWAELCQAQEKLGLDNLALPFKLWSSSIENNNKNWPSSINQKWRSSCSCQQIEVVFHFPTN